MNNENSARGGKPHKKRSNKFVRDSNKYTSWTIKMNRKARKRTKSPRWARKRTLKINLLKNLLGDTSKLPINKERIYKRALMWWKTNLRRRTKLIFNVGKN
ncbi:unnamed protein product [Linum trigynum]|uniref:50S ribosomal protein L39e n=1 Tax=Linum trigynum TaxID=586398 RepID=A0AAV2ERC6_9ROSI